MVMHSMFMSKGEDWKSRALAAEGRLANAACALEAAINEADGWCDEARGERCPGIEHLRATLRDLLPNSPAGASDEELNSTKAAIELAARGLNAKLDEVVHEGITRVLGGAQWSLAEVAGRLTRLADGVSGDATWILDGAPFLVTRDLPPVLDQNLILTFRFDYKHLYPPVSGGAADAAG